MKYRRLRIAWSVWWSIAVGLLIGMWFRSYWYRDQLYKNSLTDIYGCASNDGCIELPWISLPPGALTGTGWRRGVSYGKLKGEVKGGS